VTATGTPTGVPLPSDHPGVSDPVYRARRDHIAAISASYRRGEPVPDVDYTPAEDAVWAAVSSALHPRHLRLACREYLEGVQRLDLPTTRVPQLREVSEKVARLSGFAIEPVPGLVPTRVFYGALAERRFLSTQYIRHHSVPFYTPEPDLVHEIIGHANMLANPRFADLYELAGQASRRATTPGALEFFSRVFWFSIEFGVVWEDGELKAYGAGLLSSYGEIEAFRSAEIRPFDVRAMGTLEYDITQYQPVLFSVTSTGQLVDELGAFFATFDDEAHLRLVGSP
jgi:phenylalanine-4-hydroxylase